MTPEDEFDEEPEEYAVPETLTPAIFEGWRSPRLGRSNPERLNNPLWEWLIQSKWSAYKVTDHFRGSDSPDTGPGWCFDRFGQSSTVLPDGTTIFIAGEHEDYYDPDFFIYNDVVVRRPTGAVDIYGYPADVFPPTDFHSATLKGEQIILIGNLGYPEQRQLGVTPVAVLNLNNFAISQVETHGDAPGWLHEHTATLSPDGSSILIQGGKLERAATLVENIDDWRLSLADWRWERLTERKWQRWELRRKSGKSNHLWKIGMAQWSQSQRQIPQFTKEMRELAEMLGKKPDLTLFSQLYRPEIEFEPLPEVEGEYRVTRIRVQGVVVRYVETMHSLQITIEGELPAQVADALATDLLRKLEALENAPCELVML